MNLEIGLKKIDQDTKERNDIIKAFTQLFDYNIKSLESLKNSCKENIKEAKEAALKETKKKMKNLKVPYLMPSEYKGKHTKNGGLTKLEQWDKKLN